MSQHNSDTPMYEATTQQQGWSPRELGVAFDVEALVSASYATVADRRRTAHERKPPAESNAAPTTG